MADRTEYVDTRVELPRVETGTGRYVIRAGGIALDGEPADVRRWLETALLLLGPAGSTARSRNVTIVPTETGWHLTGGSTYGRSDTADEIPGDYRRRYATGALYLDRA